jgi:hypothetical protein
MLVRLRAITHYLISHINLFLLLAKFPNPQDEEGKHIFYLSLSFKIYVT